MKYARGLSGIRYGIENCVVMKLSARPKIKYRVIEDQKPLNLGLEKI